MLMEMAGSRSCGEERSRTTGSMTENAREPNIDVDVRGTNSIEYRIVRFKLILFALISKKVCYEALLSRYNVMKKAKLQYGRR